MKLYVSTTSPYARLAVIAALRSGKNHLQLEFVLPWQTPKALTDVNPFSQVPALLCDDGCLITETLIICQVLDPSFVLGGNDSAMLSYGIGVINQAVRYMSLKNMQTLSTPTHPMMERSINMLHAALPKAARLRPDSERWGQIVLGCALNYVRMRLPDVYAETVSADNRRAVEVFLQRDFMQKTEQSCFEQLPRTVGAL